ncbi:MAG: PEP-CTERM sorting domain-containing protein [Phycisphaera sp.]|nr:MAG: PEP-CTERM sorting domain-containing protein [Phycisphaera sp.]
MSRSSILTGLLLAGTAGATLAQPVTITFDNLQSDGGFFFTPVWVGLHDGSFDSYDGGTFASAWPGLTELAEDGDTGPISAQFGSVTGGVGVDGTLFGSDGHPTLAPGESGSIVLEAGDATTNRYFSYASMLVPTNDIFAANGNPFAHEVFDAAGNFNGPLTIEIYGSSLNDNGTEVNDAFGGAAFSANGGVGADENFVIRNVFEGANLGTDAQYFASFVGTNTATGELITHVPGPDKLLARITVVPSPASASLLAAAGIWGARRRRNAK